MSTETGQAVRAAMARAAAEQRAALIAYVTFGDPTPHATLDIVLAAVAAGADVIELGVPFSDPSADGPSIQRAMERALAATCPWCCSVITIRLSCTASPSLPRPVPTLASTQCLR